MYEDDPAVTQVKANLTAVERVQQERTKQRKLEREEWKAWVEVERLKREIEEAEKKWRELEEVELERLTQEKEKLEEEKRVKRQCVAALHWVEKVAEWIRAVLAMLLPEAGPSKAPPQNPERTTKGADNRPQIVIPKRNCMQCITRESLCQWDLDRHAWSC